jgi:hypothetical protein
MPVVTQGFGHHESMALDPNPKLQTANLESMALDPNPKLQTANLESMPLDPNPKTANCKP